MMEERTINRLVLQYLDDLRGVPQSAGDVGRFLRDRTRGSVGSAGEKSLRYLESAGYVEVAEGLCADDEPLYVITASGIRQINRRVPVGELDRMIW